jgi:3'-5' exoribonuclease
VLGKFRRKIKMKLNIANIMEGVANNTVIKGTVVRGTVYLHAFDYKASTSGKPFVSGQISDQGMVLSFKVWSENIEKFRALAEKKIVHIEGVVDTWNGTPSIEIKKLEEDIFGYVAADFLLGHDRNKLEKDFDEFVKTVLSANAQKLVNHIISGNTRERFCTEFAAKGMHDACPSGLINHTVKMLKLARTMIENDPRFIPFSDLIYTGIIFHDMGKIDELYMGQYVKNSFISHRELGCEILYNNKEYILSIYDEDFFYRLLSVIRGHHHVYEEKAKTIYAYIVHLIDMVDSQCTRLMDSLDNVSYKETSSGEKTVGHHDEVFYY